MKLADISQTYDPISPISDVRAEFQQNFDGLLKQIRGVVVISPEKVKLALLGLFAQGHVLLEDLPGVGKTLLAKTHRRFH